MERQFSPYSFHGGTCLAIAGEDYSIIASDTRLSEGFLIHTRESPKLYKLTNTTVLGCTGFHADALTVTRNVGMRLKMYEHEHGKKMSCSAIAQMLQTILYYRRFFPYYTYNIIAGLDSEGKGAIYSFDPVGSYEREKYRAEGSSSAMLQPFLDNQVGRMNQQDPSKEPLSKEQCVQFVKDIFISAAERDIHTGDGVLINVITKDGVAEEVFPLRKD
eukprot:Seg418.2 transcript_id=Seg418.2/GoldUCD/mRNA.D3Y31 product="Proteasome subunit beta type-1-A" protein_id=Seg418.2/GoldUCD/D3Y31